MEAPPSSSVSQSPLRAGPAGRPSSHPAMGAAPLLQEAFRAAEGLVNTWPLGPDMHHTQLTRELEDAIAPVPRKDAWVNWVGRPKPGEQSPAVFVSKLQGLLPGPATSVPSPPRSPTTELRTRKRSDLTAHMDMTDARRERTGEVGTREREFTSAVPLFDASSPSQLSDASMPVSSPTPLRAASCAGADARPPQLHSSVVACRYQRSCELATTVPFRVGPCEERGFSSYLSTAKSEAPASSRAQNQSSEVGALIGGPTLPLVAERPASSRGRVSHHEIYSGADLQSTETVAGRHSSVHSARSMFEHTKLW